MTTRYRIVCPNFGTKGHSTHEGSSTNWTAGVAQERADTMNAHYRSITERQGENATPHYLSEIGWRVQSRQITDWEDSE